MGPTTVFEKCVVEPENIDYVQYRKDTLHEAEVPMSDQILSHGLRLSPTVKMVSFYFVPKFGAGILWPRRILWKGPAAVLEFRDEAGTVLDTMTLKDMNFPAPYVLRVNQQQPAWARMRLVMHAGNERECEFVVVYGKGRKRERENADAAVAVAEKKLVDLLVQDEEGKDVTLLLADGEQLKAHKLVLGVYSAAYKDNVLDLKSDSKGAWELLLRHMYEQASGGETSVAFLHEAACIANRDQMLPALHAKLWARVSETIDRANVLRVLKMAWPRGSEVCLHACFAFIFKYFTTMGSSWLVEYTTCLQADPELAAYADERASCIKKQRLGS
jgi:hypothetical protein